MSLVLSAPIVVAIAPELCNGTFGAVATVASAGACDGSGAAAAPSSSARASARPRVTVDGRGEDNGTDAVSGCSCGGDAGDDVVATFAAGIGIVVVVVVVVDVVVVFCGGGGGGGGGARASDCAAGAIVPLALPL